MSCLFAAITVAACSAILSIASGMQMKVVGITKDDELDGYAATIVQKSVRQNLFVCRLDQTTSLQLFLRNRGVGGKIFDEKMFMLS
jgi:hypothetical protein